MDSQQARYRFLLGTHDWSYQFSDDYSVWVKGETQWREISELQRKIDPNYVIWNEVVPDDLKREVKQ